MKGGYVVVIPAFNEVAVIREVVLGVLAQTPNVIVVDDGSRDGTRGVLADLPIEVLVHEHNRGKGASLRTGARRALEGDYEHIVTLDGDGQHDPEDIPSLMAAARDYPDALVIGARTIKEGPRPPLRFAANRMADWAVSRVTHCQVKDSQSGFRVYPRRLFAALVESAPEGGFAFETRALIVSAEMGLRMLPIPIRARYSAHLRPSHYRPVRDTLRIARLLLREWLRQRRAVG